MSFDIAPGIYDMPADKYHTGPGVSKSNLDMVHECPAMLEWSRNAPQDVEAQSAVNVGTAFHALALEPDLFGQSYVCDFLPPAGALNTLDELKAALTDRGIEFKKSGNKKELTATLLDADPDAPVTDRMADEWAKGVKGREVLSVAEWRKLELMHGSVRAHPVARQILDAEGAVEQSHYWIDEGTGELCRSRMDKTLSGRPMIADLKTTADIGKFHRSMLDYRYHVQDAFYTDGFDATSGVRPSFVFIVVSTTRDRCRYPVRVMKLPPEQSELGRREVRADLEKYADCRRTGRWPGIESISLPEWYLAKEAV